MGKNEDGCGEDENGMINNKKVVSMIPIKRNSERVKDKNIRPFFDGKPLVSFIAETAAKSRYIDETYVYCSDETIRAYLPETARFLERPVLLLLRQNSHC